MVTTMSAADLLEAYAAGQRDFRYAHLSGADLRHAHLSDTDLYGADLRDTDLYGADLRDTDLYGADLRGANLYGANLYGANLYGAKNIPTYSHDVIAELLRQKSAMRYDRLQAAGLPLMTRDWCWPEFQRIAQAHWSVELRRWVVETLSVAGPQFVEVFEAYPFLTSAEGE